MTDPRKKLYIALSSKFDLGTFDEFNSKMDNPESRKKLYTSVSSNFDLGSYDEFESKVAPLKKKVGTKDATSTSTTSGQSLGLAPKDGSLGSQKQVEWKPVVDIQQKTIKNEDGSVSTIEQEKEVFYRDKKTGELKPAKEKVEKGVASTYEQKLAEKEALQKRAKKSTTPTLKYQEYKNSVEIPEERKAEFEKEIDDALENRGFMNGLKTGLKQFWNNVLVPGAPIELNPYAKEQEQAKEILMKEFGNDESKITPETLKAKTKEIVLNNRIDAEKINVNNKFLSDLPLEEKKKLELEGVDSYKTISDKNKYLLTESKVILGDLEKIAKDGVVINNIIKEYADKKQELPEKFIESTLKMQEEYDKKIERLTQIENEYQTNTDDLGSVEEELDFLKRNYNTVEKVKSLAKLGFGDLWVNVTKKLPIMISDLDESTLEKIRFGSEGVMSEKERQELIDDIIDWENAKELERNKFKRDVDFDYAFTSPTAFGEFFAQEVGNQLPIYAQMAMPGGVVSMGITSTADKYGQLETESNQISFLFNGKQMSGFQKEDGTIVDLQGNTFNPDSVQINSIQKPDYSKSKMLLASVGFGMAEAILGSLPTKNIMSRSVQAINNAGQRTLMREGIKQYSKKKAKGVVKDTVLESVSEGATTLTQNWIDIKVLGKKDVRIMDNVTHASFTGGLLGGMMSVVPAIAGIPMRMFSDNKSGERVRNNIKVIFDLQSQLNNPEISEASRQAIREKIEVLETENQAILTKVAETSKNMPKEVFEAIVDTNRKQEILTLQAEEIRKDMNLSPELKKELIQGLEVEYNTLEKKRSKLVSENANVLDALSDSQVNKLKTEASRVLVAEAEAQGKTEATFTDEQISKKAIEIYNQSNQDAVQQETPITETQQETQPKAEIQETEQEVKTKQKNIEKQIETVFENPIEKIQSEENNLKTPDFIENKISKEYESLDQAIEFLISKKEIKSTDNNSIITKTILLDHYSQTILSKLGLNTLLKNSGYTFTDISKLNTEDLKKQYLHIFKKLKPYTENVKVYQYKDNALDIVKNKRVAFAYGQNIYLGETSGSNLQMLLHETIHALTTSSLSENNKMYNKEFDVKITELYNKAKENIKLEYGIKNKYEFLSEAFSNPVFMKKLADIKTNSNNQTSNVFQDVLISISNFIKKTFNIDAESTLLIDTLNTVGLYLDKNRTINNETAQREDIVTDGNVRPGVEPMAEVGGTTEQITESDTEQNIQPTAETKPTEKVNPEANFDEIADFLNENFINKTDEKKEPITNSDKRANEKGNGEDTSTPTKTKREAEPKVKKISLKGRTPLSKRRFKGDRKTASNINPSDANGLVLRYFIDGGKISKQAILDLFRGVKQEFLARTRIGGYAFENVFDKKGRVLTLDELAHEIWENRGDINVDTSQIKNALEDVISSNNRINDMVNTYLKNNGEKTQNDAKNTELEYNAKNEFQEEQKANNDEMQEVEDIFDQLTDEEIIRLAENQEMAYADFIADLEKRAVTYDLGAFSETGYIQNDGSIISDVDGSILSPESVSNVQFKNKTENQSKKQQQKEAINEQVDKIAQKIKDFLPGIKDGDNLNAQGFTQDQLIDLIANAVKSLISKGIDINEAINQVVGALKQKFDFEVDVDKVKEKIEPKKKSKKEKAVSELNDFKKEKGKKSLLSRISEGTNDIVKNAIRNISLDYDVESIEGAKEAAKEIFRKLGLEESIVALSDRNSELQGAVRAFVFREASFFLENEISKMQENGIDDSVLQKFDALNDALAKIKEEMDMFGRDGGRFINALQYIYRESNGEYSLSKRVKEWESARGGEKIPAELLEKFAEAEKKAKELTEKLLELQKEKERLEAQASLETIIEDVEQTSKSKKPKRKFAVSEEKRKERQKLKQEILKDYFGGLNDVTRFVAMLGDPKVIKYLKLTLEENGGDFIDFSNALIDDLGKDVRKHVKELFLKAGGKETEITEFNHSDIVIDKEGKIKIPKAVLIDLIQQGFTEIDALSQKILDIISEDYPNTDYTLREIRDAITNYGKTIKPTENELLKKLGEMTRLGRLLSQLEDVQNGTRPKKSGLQRQKPTDLERELTRKINDLLRDNLIPLSDSETEAFIKSQNDKIKTRLENEIRDLEKQIELGEKRKVDRKPIEYSAENKELKSKRDALKEQLDALTGKPELTEEQKIKRAERLLEASIDKIQQQLLTKQVEFAKKPDPINSEKLEELRAKRKFLLEQRDALRKDLGLIEKRRLELAKKSRERSIAEIKRRLKEKDFSKKEPQPLKVDKEILEIQMELDKLKEIYEKEKYEHELEQQSLFYRVAKNLFLGIYNIPRSMLATFENSTVLIQNGYLTISDVVDDIVKTPKNLINYFRKSSESSSDKFKTPKNLRTLFSALGSAEFEENSRRELEADPLYPLAKKSGLQITTTSGKLDAKQEAFIHDMIAVALDTPGYVLKYATKDKKYTPIGNKFLNIARKALLKPEVKKEEKTALEQVKNINPQRALERGMVAYSNRMIMKKFKEGAFLLEQAGKNPIDDLEDYKQLANAINNLSGRGNLYIPFINGGKGRYMTIDPSLSSIIFFSYKLASTYLNTMNPFWHYSLKDSDSPFYKPSYAQKMAWITMAKFVTFSTSMSLLYAAAISGEDDEDEKSIYKTGYIETDPRSVNFGRIYQGNGIWVDMFVGKMQTIPLMTRVFTGESKNRYTGKIEELGYDGTPKRWDIMFQYGANKLAPTTRIAFDYANAKLVENKETGKMEKIVGFEQEPFNILKSMTMNAPLYWQTIANLKESEKERDVYNEALIASMFFGAPGISEDPFYNTSKYDVRKLRAEERFRGYALDGLAKRLHFKEITEEEINEELTKMYEGEYTSEYVKGVQRVQRRLLEYSAEEAYLKIAKANSKKEKALYLLEEFGDIYEHPNKTEVLKELKKLGFDFKEDNMTRQHYKELLEKRNK
jgi:hypothetical protein